MKRTSIMPTRPGRRVVGTTLVALALACASLGALDVGVHGAAAQEGALPRRFASSELTEDRILDALFSAHPDNFRPIGTSSVTFQLQLAGSIDAAYKPETRIHPRGWASEIAAYRIAARLGLDNVPPARVRIIERGQLRRRIAPDWHGDEELLLSPFSWNTNVPGVTTVRGAAIYWVPNLERATLDSVEGLAIWSRWLTPGAELASEQRILARDLASMCVFDVLIGNADRLSGGNLRTATHGVQRVIIRDHNLAFPARTTDAHRARLVDELRHAQRFPRPLLEALRALDAETIRAATRDDIAGPLLDDAQIASMLMRREMVLTYVGALVESYGEAQVLDL